MLHPTRPFHPIHQAAAVFSLLGCAVFGPAAHAAEMASVISSTPVIASVPVARQVCSDGQQVVQQAPSGAGAVLGAIAGGVIGHNLGNGFGRAAATGVGAVTGAVIGSQVEANANPPAVVPVRSCQTVRADENRVVGYDVIYEYAGQRYSTRMARDPGRQFAVSVQPAENGAPALPAPLATEPAPPQVAYDQPVPQTVYYGPGYYAAPWVYPAPVIGLGFGFRGHWR